MLFCLEPVPQPFSSVMKNLREVDVHYVEIVDEGLHALNGRRIKALKKLIQDRGLELTMHAPFMDVNIASSNPFLRKMVLNRLEKSILYAHQLDCQLWVFHPGSMDQLVRPELNWRLNLDSVSTLCRVARKRGVEIAIENVPKSYAYLISSVQDFSRFYNEFEEDIGIVFDIGHANINRDIHDFIKKFSKEIVHIHINDNDGIRDSHLGIGYGTIDWVDVARMIKEIKYSNIVMLESNEHVEESLQTLRKIFT